VKAGLLVVQEVGYNSNLEAERATTGLSTLHQEIVLRENLGVPPNAIERQDDRPVGMLMMKPRYQRGMNESLRTAEQAIIVATREDSLEQLFAEACRSMKPSTAGWRLEKP
jgi:hypothetical protein